MSMYMHLTGTLREAAERARINGLVPERLSLDSVPLRPCCQTCGGVILNPYRAVYLWVRDNPRDVGRQIVVCPDCNERHFGGAGAR